MSNNIYSEPYIINSKQTSYGKWEFNKIQTKLITRSFLYTGVSFVIIFLLSFTLFYVLPDDSEKSLVIADKFLIISPILIFISTIMGIFIRPKVQGGMGFIVITYLLYIIAQSLGFGGLLYAINFSSIIGLSNGINVIDVASVFGVAGLMFIAMSIIGLTMSKRSSIKFGKFIMVAVIAWLLTSLVLSITLIFTRSETTYNWIVIVVTLVGGLLNLGYIVFIVSQLKTSSTFADFVNVDHFTNTLAAFYGFWMLVNLIGLVWQLIRLLFIIRR